MTRLYGNMIDQGSTHLIKYFKGSGGSGFISDGNWVNIDIAIDNPIKIGITDSQFDDIDFYFLSVPGGNNLPFTPTPDPEGKGNKYIQITLTEQSAFNADITEYPELKMIISPPNTGSTIPSGTTHPKKINFWADVKANNSVAGYEFVRWEGDLLGNETPTIIRMNSDKVVTAVFQESANFINVNDIAGTGSFGGGTQFTTEDGFGRVLFTWTGPTVSPKAGFDARMQLGLINQSNTIKASPFPGYKIKQFIIDGVPIIGNEKVVQFTTTPSEVDVEVEFELDVVAQNYDLTTRIGVLGGGIVAPQNYTQTANDTTIQVLSGDTVVINATPDTNWSVDNWENATPTNPPDNTIAQVTVTANTVVTVNFTRDNVYLTTDIAAGDELKGCIGITGIAACSGGTSQSVPIGDTQVFVEPETGYEVDYWKVTTDGSTSTIPATSHSLTVTLTNDTTVVAYFKVADSPTLVSLTVNIVGSGGTTPSGTNDYAQGSTVIVTAVPSSGWLFNAWQNTDVHMTVIGPLQISIEMAGDESVTAYFTEDIGDGGGEDEEGGVGGGTGEAAVLTNVFFCPSSAQKLNTVSFTYQNTTGVDERVHFRAIFYSDINKTSTVYTAFSLLDVKRWYFDDNAVKPIGNDGVVIPERDTVTIFYDPEVLSQELFEQQKWQTLNASGLIEKGILCGTTYYVDVEIYRSNANQLEFLQTITLTVPCDSVDTNYWRENEDANSWLCSGQGKSDLKVGTTNGQCLFPDVSSNLCDLFLITWQRRETGESVQVLAEPSNQPICGGIWDSEEDKLYSSGQGLYDKKYLSMGYRPKVITDQSQNFYISDYTAQKILAYKCNLPVQAEEAVEEAAVFDTLCYPGYEQFLAASAGTAQVRVYEEDIVDSLIINKDETIPVVEQQNIRLDIMGIPGAYAVRLRNASDESWSDWINIDTNLFINTQVNPPQTITETDIKYDAYFIEDNRFIAPWTLPKINGVRRLCCQILTFYGITRTICVDIFVNFDILEYKVQFYWDASLTEEVPSNNGYPLLSEKKDADGVPEASSTDMYVKITFSSEQDYVGLKFNAIQQGVGDQYGLALTKNDQEGFYTGSFKLYKEDNVFNKDGLGFIDIVFPDDPINTITKCVTDESDKYNLMVREQEISRFTDLSPDDVFKEYQSGKISKVLDINELKQFYDKDDGNFRFGDPAIYRKK